MYPPTHPYHLEGIGSHEDYKATLQTVTRFMKMVRPTMPSCVSGDFDPQPLNKALKDTLDLFPKEWTVKKEAPIQTEPYVFEKTITDHIQLPAVVLVAQSAYHTRRRWTWHIVYAAFRGQDARLTKSSCMNLAHKSSMSFNTLIKITYHWSIWRSDTNLRDLVYAIKRTLRHHIRSQRHYRKWTDL